jgi:uncharacterized metal-binding protein YceD (DUF177 family)
MHVNVRDILFQGVGYNEAFKIADEHPQSTNVKLTKGVEGGFTISRLERGLLLRGNASSELELECHRCLRTFKRPVRVRFQQLFAETPEDDEQPIVDRAIDLAPVIEQEFLLSLPIKILHAPDCPGLGPEAEKYTNQRGHNLKQVARITKRNL